MNIIAAPSAGFCFGVQRAVNMAAELAKSGPCCTWGELIHNRDMLEALARQGVSAVESADKIPAGQTVLIRAHGVPQSTLDMLNARKIAFVDATCPFVAKIHRIVSDENAKGRFVVIIGDENHPEVKGILGHAQNAVVFSEVEKFENWLKTGKNSEIPISMVAQTTLHIEKWKMFGNCVKKRCTNAKIFDTICNATAIRQEDTRRIARRAEVMVVVGGAASSNTRKLAEIAGEYCPVVCVENASQLDTAMLRGAETVGLSAGASTPSWIIKEVITKMCDELNNAQVAAEEITPAENQTEESFEELLEQSIKTLNSGDKVTGIVTRVTSGEVQVDLGVKQAAYIPASEMSDDPNYKLEESVHEGDEIRAFVVRVSDVDGVIMLSKKKMDSLKGWDDLEKAVDEKTVLEGTVTELNKGGIVANVNGVRVFIPASHTGIPKDQPMDPLLKTKVRVRITEVNRARRRAVGSIRLVNSEERRAKAEALWNEIEVGNTYTGTVKSLTSYGAFVDIGGVDGMVHISELSWGRVRHPSEVLNVGDTVEVYVMKLDREKKKISLGYRRAEDNPWNKLISTYAVGDVAKVKILKFMPFGAFAEVVPGVDGLIHISQIADHRIAKPEEALTEGEEVDAKIIDIDMERQKISLSIRALLEEGDEE